MDTLVADALVGRTVDNRYRVDARLAVGGMATVYRATDLRLDRQVALKVMRPNLADDPEFVARFVAEARAAARLSHPNAVAVYDQGAADGLVYLAMEYVSGRTLRQLLHEVGPLRPEQALSILDQALQALAAAHAAGFLHRDIKPENVLIADSGAVKVTDFGLARALNGPSSLTRGVLIGTAAYLAPEQVAAGTSDERTDVYQAGVLLYELLTGAAPHTGDTAWQVAYQHVNTDVPPPSVARPGLPASLDALVADATARDPGRRLPDTAAFRSRIEDIAETLPAPQPFPERTVVLSTAGGDPDAATDVVPVDDQAGDDPAPPDGDPDEDQEHHRGWRFGIVIVTVLVAVAALAGWVAANGNPFNRTEVPTVVGTTEAKAKSVLRAVGFQTEVGRSFSETVAAGTVIGVDPQQGSNAITGSVIHLNVSLGPERYEVPRVKGLTPQAATAKLAETHLVVGSTGEAYHDTVAAGLVIRTVPKTGSEVKRDAVIDLLVSKGPAPVKVPNLAGMAKADAQAKLAELGLQPDFSEQESSDVAKGAVISTTPKAGTTLHRGDTLAVLVSSGPPPVAMPNLVDMPRDEALAALAALGLQANVEEGVVTPLNRVYSQDPTPGTMVEVGSTVTISIF